ncbi:MAG TPA: LamG-like jellyroll fold domain-containing protein [Polyangiaceae bacterium]|nr:LamG-like jellyroll fold domain-containing protein [Polyangiaceae bacterium]
MNFDRWRAAGALVGLSLVFVACSGNDSGSNPTSNPSGGSSGASTVGGAAGTTSAGAGGQNVSGGELGGTTAAGAGAGNAAGSGGTGGTSTDSCAGPEAPSNYPSATFTPDADTVAWYKLDDLTDSGPSGLTLTNTGNVAFTKAGLEWPESANNGVARFSGAEQSLTRTGLTLGNDFTLDAHVFWRGFRDRTCGDAAELIWLKNGNAGVAFGQACGSAVGPRVRINDTTNIVAATAFDDVADDSWHWVRFAFAAGKVSFELDGVTLGTSATTIDNLTAATWTLQLGSVLRADIDEVRLIKKALPPAATAPKVTARPAYRELTVAESSAELTAKIDKDTAKVSWSKLSGPGKVVFSAPSALTTRASFCEPGKYVLQAVAAEADATASDQVVVRVWPAEGRKTPYKVLFVGNSFSFYNGTVGYRFWEYSKAAGEAVGDNYAQSPYVKMMTSPGQTFQYHWYENNQNSECTNCTDHVLPAPPTVNLTDFAGKNAQDIIADGEWDVVVMHSYSTAASRDPENFFRYGKKLDRLIKRSGARVVLYQTWAYPGGDDTAAEEATLLGNYEKLAQDLGSALSKVGTAFKDAHAELNGWAAWPNGILFTDNKHPSSFGTYLAAGVHFATIYGKSPATLPLYPGAADVSAPTIDSDKTKADKLRDIAARYAATTPLQSGP